MPRPSRVEGRARGFLTGKRLPAAGIAAGACFDSEDYREGRTAFMEKRPPQFVGR